MASSSESISSATSVESIDAVGYVPSSSGTMPSSPRVITKDTIGLKFNTTSTVYAEQLVSQPDFSQVLFCVACILQSVIFDDIDKAIIRQQQPPPRPPSATDLSYSYYPELDMVTQLPPHLGGLQHPATIAPEILAKETKNDPALYERIMLQQVPTVDTVLRFLAWIFESAAFSAECNIIAFVYVKRLMSSGLLISNHNWRGIWIGAIVLAQKLWDDIPLRTSSFAKVLPGVGKPQLRDIEIRLFGLLDFSVNVRPSMYARYYFELRDIYKCLVGTTVPMEEEQQQHEQQQQGQNLLLPPAPAGMAAIDAAQPSTKPKPLSVSDANRIKNGTAMVASQKQLSQALHQPPSPAQLHQHPLCLYHVPLPFPPPPQQQQPPSGVSVYAGVRMPSPSCSAATAFSLPAPTGVFVPGLSAPPLLLPPTYMPMPPQGPNFMFPGPVPNLQYSMQQPVYYLPFQQQQQHMMVAMSGPAPTHPVHKPDHLLQRKAMGEKSQTAADPTLSPGSRSIYVLS